MANKSSKVSKTGELPQKVKDDSHKSGNLANQGWNANTLEKYWEYGRPWNVRTGKLNILSN
jgi:hypothetical protein